MRCAWKFHPFGCKCVCSSYCFYADLTIYEFCNLKRIITVTTTVVEGQHVEARERWKFGERWRFARLDWRFGLVKNSECTESSSAWMFVCFLCAIFTLLCMLILQKLCFYKEAVLLCFMLISIFFTSSQKGDNSSNSMGGSVRSTFQEVQRIHELQFLYASFMLSLSYRLCSFYKDYAMTKMSSKNLCYNNTMLLYLFI